MATNYVGLYNQTDSLTGNPFFAINNNGAVTITGTENSTIYVGLLIKTYNDFNVVLSNSGQSSVSFMEAISSNSFANYTNPMGQGVLALGFANLSGTYGNNGSVGYVIPIRIDFIMGTSITLTFSNAVFSGTNTPAPGPGPAPGPAPTSTVSPSRTVPRLIYVNGTPTFVSSKIQKKSNIIVQNNTNTGTTSSEVTLSDKYIIYKLYDEVVDGLVDFK